MRKTVGRWTDGTANDFGYWHAGEPNDWGTLPDGSEGAVCDCSLGLGGCATGHGSVQDLAHGGEDCVIARKGAVQGAGGAMQWEDADCDMKDRPVRSAPPPDRPSRRFVLQLLPGFLRFSRG